MSLRLYSFVAGLYLSDLQKGLQTAHVVSELYDEWTPLSGPAHAAYHTLHEWAMDHKTIIILNTLNHGGVVKVHDALKAFGKDNNLPYVIFHEDEESMCNMATACGIVLPPEIYDTQFEQAANPIEASAYVHYVEQPNGEKVRGRIYLEGTKTFDFIKLLKSYRLA